MTDDPVSHRPRHLAPPRDEIERAIYDSKRALKRRSLHPWAPPAAHDRTPGYLATPGVTKRDETPKEIPDDSSQSAIVRHLWGTDRSHPRVSSLYHLDVGADAEHPTATLPQGDQPMALTNLPDWVFKTFWTVVALGLGYLTTVAAPDVGPTWTPLLAAVWTPVLVAARTWVDKRTAPAG